MLYSNKDLKKLIIPLVIEQTLAIAVGMADTIMISVVGEAAVSGVSLVDTVNILLINVFSALATGGAVVAGHFLGQKHPEEASKAAWQIIMFATTLALAISIIFIGFHDKLLRLMFGKIEPEVMQSAKTYLIITALSFSGLAIYNSCAAIFRSMNNAKVTMWISLLINAINITGNAICIFGLKWGVAGAAIATVGGQAVSMVLGFVFLFRKGNLVTIRLKGFRPQWSVVADSYRVGLPSIVMQAIGSVTTFALNKILYLFTPTAVSVLGVYFKLQSFVFMPVFGLNSGAMPIMGYNFGARNKKRLMQALKCGALYALAIMTVGLLVFQLFPDVLLALFDASDHMMQIGVRALRTISFCFPFAAIGIMLSTLFQAVGQGVNSMIMSLCRQIIVLIPAAYFLAMEWGLDAVWYAFLIAEGVSLFVCITLLRRTYTRYIEPLGADAEAEA